VLHFGCRSLAEDVPMIIGIGFEPRVVYFSLRRKVDDEKTGR